LCSFVHIVPKLINHSKLKSYIYFKIFCEWCHDSKHNDTLHITAQHRNDAMKIEMQYKEQQRLEFSVIMLCVIIMNVVKLCVIIVNVVKLCVIIMNVVKLCVIIMNVVKLCRYHECC
jgi:hypothetical protein